MKPPPSSVLRIAMTHFKRGGEERLAQDLFTEALTPTPIPSPMPPSARTAIERRTWRLAFLLTGNPNAASSLIERVFKIQKNPASLEPALLDRLIIQNARYLPKSTEVILPRIEGVFNTAPAAAALTAALSLPHQPLEAWTLRRIDDLNELHIARAMDCSKTAARLHLASADDRLTSLLGEKLLPSAAALRTYADALDPAPLITAYRHKARRRRIAKLKLWAIIVAAATLLISFAVLKYLLSTA